MDTPRTSAGRQPEGARPRVGPGTMTGAAAAEPTDSRVVTVEIHGQQYPIRSGLDPAYVVELASYLDAKMRAAARETAAGETVKVAVLAALNIADECFRLKAEDRERRDSITTRAEELERMLDLALAEAPPPGVISAR